MAEVLSGTGIPSALHYRGREWQKYSQEQEYHQHSIIEKGVAEVLSGTGIPSALHYRGREWQKYSQEQETPEKIQTSL